MNLPEVMFTGYYGMQNTGDDAFCAVSAWGARNLWGTERVRFLASSLPDMGVPAEAVLSPRTYFRGQTVLEIAIKLAGQRMLVHAGGSTFHSPIRSFSLNGVARRLLRCGRLQLGAMGVSLGPFRTIQAERDWKECLRHFSFLVLRDRRSYEIATGLGGACHPLEGRDLAFLLPRVYGLPGRGRNRKPVLGVSVCHYERYLGQVSEKEHEREAAILEALRLLLRQVDVTIRLFVFNGHPVQGDAGVTREIASRLPRHTEVEVVEYSRRTRDTWLKMGECDAFFSTRMHGAILAAAARVPFVLVEYHRKCGDLLDDLRYPSDMRIGDMASPPGIVADILARLVVPSSTCNIMSQLDEAERLALRNFTLARE